MKSRTVSHNSLRRPLVIIGLFVVCAFAAIITLEKTGAIDLIRMDGGVPKINAGNKPAETTSTLPSAQSDYTGGAPRSTDVNVKLEGTVNDQKGLVPEVPPEASWTKSSSGKLVVYTPSASTLLRDGDTLSGGAADERVYFRLIDNLHGIIAQGSLAVVNQKYSGNFDFATNASEGQLDVFTQSYDGTEANNISIPVRFK